MNILFHQLIDHSLNSRSEAGAISYRGRSTSYAELENNIASLASGLIDIGIKRGDRIAIYLPKQEETVISFLGISRAGGIFVPVNHILKAPQAAHILSDCGAKFLITSNDRAKTLASILPDCKSLKGLIIIDSEEGMLPDIVKLHNTVNWQEILQSPPIQYPDCNVDDSVAILYTSGSTGRPKGVVLSHKNLVLGTQSVCQYLNITQTDRILSLLPFSFDYGLNQLTTTLYSGACTVLMNYLLPQEVTKIIAEENITGLAAVPSLWAQLAKLEWPEKAQKSLRYITNSGSTMPTHVLEVLQKKLPGTDIILMYGLTEAFRSTFLPPNEVNERPSSIGKAIPNAELAIVKPDGSRCAPGESGELVHLGPLVAKGYWNSIEKTAKRFKPLPGEEPGGKHTPAVWTGDIVSMDKNGYITFIGREDDMIKTSGYRVSPTEIEEELYKTGLVNEAVVFGVPHHSLGQAIVAVITSSNNTPDLTDKILHTYKKNMPLFMVPMRIDVRKEIPKTNHGKPDRKKLSIENQNLFTASSSANDPSL